MEGVGDGWMPRQAGSGRRLPIGREVRVPGIFAPAPLGEAPGSVLKCHRDLLSCRTRESLRIVGASGDIDNRCRNL
jgi:hypothetical protein